MELYDLGLEYLSRCEILLARIKQLNIMTENISDNEKILLKRRIAMLTADASHCRECALILINYHRKDNNYDQKQIQPRSFR